MALKITPSYLKAVLKEFGEADNSDLRKPIEFIKSTRPTKESTLATFRFDNHYYTLVQDELISDDEALARMVKQLPFSDKAKFLDDPQNPASKGVFYKGRTIYLFKSFSDKQRLDIVLSQKYPDISRSTWQKYIKQGLVSVNGSIASRPKFEISPNDDVSIELPEKINHSRLTLPILYIDDNVIVINKPIGILSHAKGALNDEFTVAGFFQRFCDSSSDVSRPGIVHRLDRDTSGVMIGARNSAAHKMIVNQFKSRTVKKTYLAVVDGLLEDKQAIIDLPLARNPTKPSQFIVSANGQEAITAYRILQESNQQSLVELNPLTGRTHQLRVHMSYLKTPISGDRLYGKPAERLYLHAKSLEITIPGGIRKQFLAPVPEGFTERFKNVNS